MWALFNNSQPQNINGKNSFKSNFLMQQIKMLEMIQKQTKEFQQQLNKALRFSHKQFCIKSKQSQLAIIQDKCTIIIFRNLRENAIQLSEVINKANQSYQQSVQSRDLQKIHDHLFFKSAMRNYDDKRKQLKQYTFELQNKVQEKQFTAVSQRSYRNINIPIVTQSPISQISQKFRNLFDSLDLGRDKVNFQLIKNDFLSQKASQKFKANQNQELKKLQTQSMEQQIQMFGLYSLLQIVRTKQKTINQGYSETLKTLRSNSTQLNLQNKSIRQASLKLQNEITFLEIQNNLGDSQSTVFRSDCIEYLKQVNQKLKKRFNQGVNFNRSKNRSKSLVYIPFVNNKQKLAKNSTKDTYQKNSELDCDLSSSFMQHCQYLISQKFIVDGDEQNV